MLEDPVVAIQILRPQDLAGLSPARRGSLHAQRFHGRPGDRAVEHDADLIILIGAGDSPEPEDLRRALEGAGLAEGTRVSVTVPPEVEVALPDWRRTAEAALRSCSLEPVWPTTADDASPVLRLGAAEAAALQRARGWTNAPASDLPPARLADAALDHAGAYGLEATVLDRAALDSTGFGSILAVGAGSPHDPCLVDLRYRPAVASARIVLVGKGVTFDTGGLSLKTPSAMAGMRMDKAGASVVLATILAAAEAHIECEVRALLPLAENMVGPGAVRPGDVVTAWNGTPITIMDTDFEGRVLMADALAYGSADRPDAIIDVATLTYQVAIALGHDIGGYFANDDDLARLVEQASYAAGEALWRLPLAGRYRDQVDCGAGVKNHPETDVGRAITAALFLERFVEPGVPWAHLDLTGPSWSGPASSEGATGFGVRTLLRMLESFAAR